MLYNTCFSCAKCSASSRVQSPRGNNTPLVRWLHKSTNSISWKFQASSWTFQPKLPKVLYKFHDSGPLPLETSQILQTNFIKKKIALWGFHILNFPTSCLLILHSLSFRYSLPSLCFFFGLLEASSLDVNFSFGLSL